jgi:hypothetical protein
MAGRLDGETGEDGYNVDTGASLKRWKAYDDISLAFSPMHGASLLETKTEISGSGMSRQAS